jgi:hypothetical protein
MAVEQVTLKCTDNGREVKANLVSKTPQQLVVFIPATDTKMTLMWRATQYVGNRAGLEFTSTGKTT